MITKLKEAFADALAISTDQVTDDLKYRGIPEWDSISHMVLISELEEEFDVEIETDDVIDMSSFQKAQEILTKYGVKF
jgi:acyl carrier protein